MQSAGAAKGRGTVNCGTWWILRKLASNISSARKSAKMTASASARKCACMIRPLPADRMGAGQFPELRIRGDAPLVEDMLSLTRQLTHIVAIVEVDGANRTSLKADQLWNRICLCLWRCNSNSRRSSPWAHRRTSANCPCWGSSTRIVPPSPFVAVAQASTVSAGDAGYSHEWNGSCV
ncbi:hypothetical protein BC827DRAFT_784088 [Russula dissimulans]|nr:hypothetical protein BC827DRAFT_784088 [Russula dissimulans]